MIGADLVEDAIDTQRREVPLSVENRHSTPDVTIITPLDSFSSKRRTCKSLIPFADINISCKKFIYKTGIRTFVSMQAVLHRRMLL